MNDTVVETLRYLVEYFDIRNFLVNNPPLRLLIIMSIMLIMGVMAYFLCALIHKKLVKYTKIKYQKDVKTSSGQSKMETVETAIDVGLFGEVMHRTKILLYLLILGWGLKQLIMGPTYNYAINAIFTAIWIFVAIRFVTAFVSFDIDVYLRRRGTTLKTSQTRSIMPVIKGVIWAVGLTLLLDNLGCHVSTLIAGLGIVGVAVGLAGQAILADFFSYLVLLVDKPFRIGDFIELSNGKKGEIEYMGPKTTRLRSLEGNMVVCANSEMTKGVIINQGNVDAREVEIEIGVALNVPLPIVRKVPEVIKEVVESFPQCEFERAAMLNFGTANYLFQLIYRVRSEPGGLTAFMNTQSEINLALTDRMNKEKMFGAYPTQQILLTNVTPVKSTASAA